MSLSQQDIEEFLAFCRNCTDQQLARVYLKELQAKRKEYAQLARAVLVERGLL